MIPNQAGKSINLKPSTWTLKYNSSSFGPGLMSLQGLFQDELSQSTLPYSPLSRGSQNTWTERRSNPSILKEINPEYSLEGLMLKLEIQYFGYLMRTANALEKTLKLGKTEGRRRRRQQRMRWLDGIINSMDVRLSRLREDSEGQGSLACCSPWGRKESERDWATKQQKNESPAFLLYMGKAPGTNRMWAHVAGREGRTRRAKSWEEHQTLKRCGEPPFINEETGTGCVMDQGDTELQSGSWRYFAQLGQKSTILYSSASHLILWLRFPHQ